MMHILSARRLMLGALALLVGLSHLCVINAISAEGDVEPHPATVYGITYYDGLLYNSTMAPPSIDTVYVLANETSFLNLRQTLIYYWPLTHKYLADWTIMNELVSGTLEIDGSGETSSIESADYLIQYDRKSPRQTLNVYTGEDAEAKAVEFQQIQDDYQAALMEHSIAEQAWRDQADAYLKATPGARAELPVPPPPPTKPKPITLMSSDVQHGFPVKLPEGTYTIHVRGSDGEIIAGTTKSLVVYREQQNAVGYDVIPEQRWTRPEQSEAPFSTIYSSANTTIFLQPYWQGKVPAMFDAKMRDPQDTTALPGDYTWVAHEPVSSGTLRIERDGETVADVSLQSFVVQQAPGPTLGYTVVPFDARSMTEPSFQGFQLDASLIEPDATIVFLDNNGDTLSGSNRHLRTVRPQRISLLYLGASLPLASAAGIWFFGIRASRHPMLKQ